MPVASGCERGLEPVRRGRGGLGRALVATSAALALLAAAQPASARSNLTPPANGELTVATPHDPLEWLNRRFYAIHRFLDRVLLRPLALAYEKVTPKPVRTGVHNFVGNLGEPLVFANDIVQLHFERGGRTLVRFAANSTFGIGGLVDIGSKTGLPHHDNDFGLTMAHYGVQAGPYIFLPLLGPSTMRDLAGTVVDFAADPLTFTHYSALNAFNTTTWVVGGLDERANAESDLQQIDEMGTDSYATMRSLYLQNRQAQIEDKPVDIQNLPSFDEPGGTADSAASGPAAEPAPGPPPSEGAPTKSQPAPQPGAAPAPQSAPAPPTAAPVPGPSAMLDGPITTAPGFELPAVRS